MMEFKSPPQSRDQLILFPQKLDQIIASDHTVRLFDDVLRGIDWSKWEAAYDLQRGQPPIHPRVLASAILYGLLNRIRTSRALEEALQVRNDFRWLVQGESIDHTTLSSFRQKNSATLKDLFVQIVLVARQLGHLPLASLGFDGTRIRANNRRSGTKTPEELRRAKIELAAKFAELEAKTASSDAADNEALGQAASHQLDKDLADVNRRRKKVDAALAELAKIEADGLKIPSRLPITDPQSRVSPNKEGGFAPNYTPTATVDIDSGLIVSVDVISGTDEARHMIAAVQDVQQSFGLASPPKQLLADGMMSTGENLSTCQELGIDLYSPIKLGNSRDNPAVRPDGSVPVASADIDRLPVTTTKQKDGSKATTFNKDAFIYDAGKNCYWCPAGKALTHSSTSHVTSRGRSCVCLRFAPQRQDCAACPLASRCLTGKSQVRRISHEQHESLRIAHAVKMNQQASKDKYAQRRHPGERPFATIKQQFGARSFLTRGLDKVRNEWLWLSSAFNLHRLMSLIQSNQPPPTIVTTS